MQVASRTIRRSSLTCRGPKFSSRKVRGSRWMGELPGLFTPAPSSFAWRPFHRHSPTCEPAYKHISCPPNHRVCARNNISPPGAAQRSQLSPTDLAIGIFRGFVSKRCHPTQRPHCGEGLQGCCGQGGPTAFWWVAKPFARSCGPWPLTAWPRRDSRRLRPSRGRRARRLGRDIYPESGAS